MKEPVVKGIYARGAHRREVTHVDRFEDVWFWQGVRHVSVARSEWDHWAEHATKSADPITAGDAGQGAS